MKKRIIILGAAGRDFHNYNVLFRDNAEYEVVAFTAEQIPYISDRTYPKELSGKLYPKGIKIYEEKELPDLIRRFKADICILSYSDLSFNTVMEKASLVNACGADFWLVSPGHTMIKSKKPVLAVCAVRTGSGKSQTTRYVSLLLKRLGLKPVIIRHPMPYGNLNEETVQRFATLKDLIKNKTTIEEREEYELHIKNGIILYAGVDYQKILEKAEKEADVIIWDGGNNDAPFYKPDLMITVADPLRAGNEISYYPGEICARMADVLVINKVNSASPDQIAMVVENLKMINPNAKQFLADSTVRVDNPRQITGKRVLVIEDGPTITHGNMSFGAGTVAARQYNAKEIINAKRYAVGTIRETFEKYPKLDKELPAMGYSAKQIKDLENTVNLADCDSIVSATPTDLRNIINANKPIVQAYYDLTPRDRGFDNTIKTFADKIKKRRREGELLLNKNLLYVLLVLGILVSVYLTISKYDQSVLICPSTGLVNCESVITSSYSSIFGIPLSILGLLLFIAGFYMLFKTDTMVFLWSIAGAGGVLYSISSQAILGLVCVYCLLLDLIILATIYAVNAKPKTKTTIPPKPAPAPMNSQSGVPQ